MHTIRLILADDHLLVLEGLRSLLEAEPDMEVSATANDGEGFLETLRLHRPDVAVLDLGMPGMNGLDCLSRLQAEPNGARILVLTGRDDADSMRAAWEHGAVGYARKADSRAHVLAAIRQVHRGQFSFPIAARQMLLNRPPPSLLTEREHAVLALVAEGLSNAQISRRLGVSGNTVKYHLQNVFLKLGVRNRTGAAAAYLRDFQAPN